MVNLSLKGLAPRGDIFLYEYDDNILMDYVFIKNLTLLHKIRKK